MGLKTPGVINLFKSGFKEQGGFKFGWAKLMKHHGVASGVFTCDEHLNGASPTQGTETCTVVELMYSIETLIGLGDYGAELPDILERIAYNALPAAFTPDMSGHQYDQQVNQVKVSREPRKLVQQRRRLEPVSALNRTSAAARRTTIRAGRSLCRTSGTRRTTAASLRSATRRARCGRRWAACRCG